MSSAGSSYPSLWASASQHYREFQFAMMTLLVYDHAITLGSEFDFFWRGPLSLSKVLYLSVRLKLFYHMHAWWAKERDPLPLPLACSNSSDSGTENALVSHQTPWIRKSRMTFPLKVYIFGYFYAVDGDHDTLPSALVRIFVIGTLCSTIAASCAMLSPLLGNIEKLITSTTPSSIRSTGKVVWLFVPSLGNHSILFALKVYRFVQGRKSLHTEAPLRRFLKEGMLMYAFAMGSLVFMIVGLSSTAPSQISVYLTALAGWASYPVRSLLNIAVLSVRIFAPYSFPTATIVVAVCRVMLSIRSLAATSHVDPEWLLSNAEMSRLPLREGPNKSELCVEMISPQR
ncbi:hypothetical protein EDD17DRAFT_1750774 [Pisolithus thermaeus]|nr:hypothetical protein EDD17DRAFT_1750774 [Pisolithus thermaeus]